MSFTHLSHSVCVFSKTSSINSWRLQLTDSRRLNCLVGSCLLLLLICDWRGFNHFRTSRNAAEGYRADISTDGSHWLVWWWAIISLYHHKTRVVVITICHNDKNISTISNFIWVTTACSFSIRWLALVMEWSEWSKRIIITGNHQRITAERYHYPHAADNERHWLVTSRSPGKSFCVSGGDEDIRTRLGWVFNDSTEGSGSSMLHPSVSTTIETHQVTEHSSLSRNETYSSLNHTKATKFLNRSLVGLHVQTFLNNQPTAHFSVSICSCWQIYTYATLWIFLSSNFTSKMDSLKCSFHHTIYH